MPLTWIKAVAVSLGLTAQPVPVDSPPFPAPYTQTCLKTCSVGENGYALIREFEGYMPYPYADIAGIQTVGYGYVILPDDKFTFPLLPDQADALLKTTMRVRFEPKINKLVVVRLRQNQFDALGSWSYNLGVGSLQSSTMLKRVNAQQNSLVPGEMLKWDKAKINGVPTVVSGLARRRAAEGALYSGGD